METTLRRGSPPFSASYFKCTRLNKSTFLIVEDDIYGEHPFIYVKIYNDPPLVMLSDTGCGGKGPNNLLRSFIETVPVPSNDNRPLNPRLPHGAPTKRYLIICTHCHSFMNSSYDHILGLPSFKDVAPSILASSRDKSFMKDLPQRSQCHWIGIPTPSYTISHWAKDFENTSFAKVSLGVQILHTPGHAPDELAWYDAEERHLYVGDTFYERVAEDNSYITPIMFPKEGSVIDYMCTLDKLLDFVVARNAEPGKSPVKLGCGHITASVDGEEILLAVRKHFWDLIGGKIPVKSAGAKRGEIYDLWQEDGEPRFSVDGPRRLVTDARRHYKMGPSADASHVIM